MGRPRPFVALLGTESRRRRPSAFGPLPRQVRRIGLAGAMAASHSPRTPKVINLADDPDEGAPSQAKREFPRVAPAATGCVIGGRCGRQGTGSLARDEHVSGTTRICHHAEAARCHLADTLRVGLPRSPELALRTRRDRAPRHQAFQHPSLMRQRGPRSAVIDLRPARLPTRCSAPASFSAAPACHVAGAAGRLSVDGRSTCTRWRGAGSNCLCGRLPQLSLLVGELLVADEQRPAPVEAASGPARPRRCPGLGCPGAGLQPIAHHRRQLLAAAWSKRGGGERSSNIRADARGLIGARSAPRPKSPGISAPDIPRAQQQRDVGGGRGRFRLRCWPTAWKWLQRRRGAHGRPRSSRANSTLAARRSNATDAEVRRAMDICVDNANRAIFNAARNPQYAGMGTTLVAVRSATTGC